MPFLLMSTNVSPSGQTVGIKFLNSDPLPYSQNHHRHQWDFMLYLYDIIILKAMIFWCLKPFFLPQSFRDGLKKRLSCLALQATFKAVLIAVYMTDGLQTKCKTWSWDFVPTWERGGYWRLWVTGVVEIVWSQWKYYTADRARSVFKEIYCQWLV